ncbi:hypothetical protein F7O91_34790, partial [Pseudomonas aeruginosa]|uniref:hypothetical protein n=1 Tax=Pseudomonas aeruginosa TaxID=287 RepID=UPI001247D66A
LQQAADGVARAIQGLRLDQLGDGEQHADHRRFRPLADEHGAGLPTYRKGWIALKNRNLNINALMSIAVTGAVLIGQWPEAA